MLLRLFSKNFSTMNSNLLSSIVILLTVSSTSSAPMRGVPRALTGYPNDWMEASFTYYGGESDKSMDPRITGGACKGANLLTHDQIQPSIDAEMYAAPSDAFLPLFGTSACTKQKGSDPVCFGQTSCGRCFELRCKSQFEVDDRSKRRYAKKYCKEKKSVRVKVIDACPKDHDENGEKKFNPCAMSSHPHLDIAAKAFDTIANTQAGIVWGEVREVSCDQLGPAKNGLKNLGV